MNQHTIHARLRARIESGLTKLLHRVPAEGWLDLAASGGSGRTGRGGRPGPL